MSQDEWTENEMNHKKNIIADLRQRLHKEKEVFEQMNQVMETAS
jgi:predicted RNase H-like nuclease (RuvC/YqgF family)